MKKVLVVASVTIHIKAFHIPYLKMFKDAGYEVHVASNGEDKIEYCDKHFNLSFSRSPFNKDNIKVYKELKKIIEEGEYDVVQCNTPVASVLTRLAAKKARKNGTRVIYMAHGFHFFNGAPIKNWLIFYPIEKYLSKYTDDLITINEEDYKIAKERFKAKNTYHVHGIGIDISKFNNSISVDEKEKTKKDLGLNKEDFVMAFVGELSHRKNQIMLIEAMNVLAKENNNLKLLLIGKGPLREYFENKIKEYNLEENVFLLGYRKDIPNLLSVTDLYVAASKQEGLAVNIMEAKVSNLPIIVTNSRGQGELVDNEINGYVVERKDVKGFITKIQKLYEDKELINSFKANAQKDMEKYYLENVFREIKNIYLK